MPKEEKKQNKNRWNFFGANFDWPHTIINNSLRRLLYSLNYDIRKIYYELNAALFW